MTERFEGVVAKIATKTGNGKRGKWTLYSFQLTSDSGQGTWITYGFDKEPPFDEGDRVSIEAQEDNNGYLKYVEGTGRIVSGKPVAKGISSAAQPTADSGKSAAAEPTKREVAEASRQNQIVWQHSQEMAIATVGLLLQHDGLPMTTSKTKASQAQRFDEIVAAVDKFTVKFANDVTTGRVPNTVADMGVVSVTAKDSIPAADKQKESADTSGDEY